MKYLMDGILLVGMSVTSGVTILSVATVGRLCRDLYIVFVRSFIVSFRGFDVSITSTTIISMALWSRKIRRSEDLNDVRSYMIKSFEFFNCRQQKEEDKCGVEVVTSIGQGCTHF